MELYGLKTKDGLEYKLIIPSTVATNEFIRVEVIEPNPEFKVGDWVIGKELYFYPKEPRLVTTVKGNGCYYFDDLDKANRNFCNNVHLRHATPQEIEQHLRKICDEKGYRDGVRIKEVGTNNIYTLERHREWYYLKESDSFHGCTPSKEWDIGHSNPYIYHKGQFAEIVSEKKKLPKTKEELIDFIVRDLYQFFYTSDLPKILRVIEGYEDI